MRIIFSRKGFDQKAGAVASPIFPDGGMCSLPIPSEGDQKHPPTPKYRVRFKDLTYDDKDLGSIVKELTFNPRSGKSRIKGDDYCHLDPDLIRGDLSRKLGWLPMFGQSNAAAAHLLNHGVRAGDLFLFYGWFHRVHDVQGHMRFDPKKLDGHVIFGWLQVGEIWCEFNGAYPPKWARQHPHFRDDVKYVFNLNRPLDAVFTATKRLEIPGIRRRLPGGGVFNSYHDDLCLSSSDPRRSIWALPRWMYPFPGRLPVTYHDNQGRWRLSGKRVFLQTVGRGQEFILDLEPEGNYDRYPVDKAYKWLAQLLRHAN
jgi:Nucleotide modification associated domain 3